MSYEGNSSEGRGMNYVGIDMSYSRKRYELQKEEV